jgi:hypothetical protein
MKIYVSAQEQAQGQSLFLLMTDTRKLFEIRYFQKTKILKHRSTGTAGKLYCVPASWQALKKTPGYLIKLCNELNLEPTGIKVEPNAKNCVLEDKIMACKETVLGYACNVERFNTIGRCFIGSLNDPARGGKSTRASWDKRGKCMNRLRTDCDLKLA